MPLSRLMSLDEAGQIMGCSAAHVRRLVNFGELKATRTGMSARTDMVHPVDIEEFMERRRVRLSPPVIPHKRLLPLSSGRSIAEMIDDGRKRRLRQQKKLVDGLRNFGAPD